MHMRRRPLEKYLTEGKSQIADLQPHPEALITLDVTVEGIADVKESQRSGHYSLSVQLCDPTGRIKMTVFGPEHDLLDIAECMRVRRLHVIEGVTVGEFNEKKVLNADTNELHVQCLEAVSASTLEAVQDVAHVVAPVKPVDVRKSASHPKWKTSNRLTPNRIIDPKEQSAKMAIWGSFLGERTTVLNNPGFRTDDAGVVNVDDDGAKSYSPGRTSVVVPIVTPSQILGSQPAADGASIMLSRGSTEIIDVDAISSDDDEQPDLLTTGPSIVITDGVSPVASGAVSVTSRASDQLYGGDEEGFIPSSPPDGIVTVDHSVGALIKWALDSDSGIQIDEMASRLGIGRDACADSVNVLVAAGMKCRLSYRITGRGRNGKPGMGTGFGLKEMTSRMDEKLVFGTRRISLYAVHPVLASFKMVPRTLGIKLDSCYERPYPGVWQTRDELIEARRRQSIVENQQHENPFSDLPPAPGTEWVVTDRVE